MAHRPFAALCVAAALACTACADGYPSEDLPPLDAASLDRAGLLQALHDLAEQPYLKPRRSFQLDDACVIEVRVHRRGAPQRGSTALPAAQVELRFDGDSRRYDVMLRPVDVAAGDASEPPAVLAGARWVDAVSARMVLRHLQADCLRSA